MCDKKCSKRKAIWTTTQCGLRSYCQLATPCSLVEFEVWIECVDFLVFSNIFLDLRFRGRHFSPPLPPTLFPVPHSDARSDDPRRTIKLSHYLPGEFKLLIGTKPSSRYNSIASKKPTGSWTFRGRALLTLVQYRATARQLISIPSNGCPKLKPALVISPSRKVDTIKMAVLQPLKFHPLF